MKKGLICMLVCLLLTGCTVSPAAPDDSTQPVTEPSTTVPPDPMEVLLDSMSREELVGQLFLARYPGLEKATASLSQYHLGGYVLFGQDFKNETPQSIAATIQHLQEQSALPLLIATDEEGGDVARVSAYEQYRSERFSSPRKLYGQGGLQLVLDTEAEKCQLLRSVGVNVNMGPVCDVTTDRSAFIYSRSLGQEPEITGEFAAGVVKIMEQHGIGSVLKHFPGYGNNTRYPHWNGP